MFSNTCYNTGLGSYQKWYIGHDVRDILLADADIYAIVGEKVFPCVAPEDTKGEFIIYQREKYSKDTVKQGVYSDECKLAITAVADDYDMALDMAALLDNALTGKHTNKEGKQFTMILADSSEGFQENKFIETLLFNIE